LIETEFGIQEAGSKRQKAESRRQKAEEKILIAFILDSEFGLLDSVFKGV
jgi:hypothetical protein